MANEENTYSVNKWISNLNFYKKLLVLAKNTTQQNLKKKDPRGSWMSNLLAFLKTIKNETIFAKPPTQKRILLIIYYLNIICKTIA